MDDGPSASNTTLAARGGRKTAPTSARRSPMPGGFLRCSTSVRRSSPKVRTARFSWPRKSRSETPPSQWTSSAANERWQRPGPARPRPAARPPTPSRSASTMPTAASASFPWKSNCSASRPPARVFGNGECFRLRAAMPETAIREHRDPLPAKGEIWFAEESRATPPAADFIRAKKRHHSPLRVLAPAPPATAPSPRCASLW